MNVLVEPPRQLRGRNVLFHTGLLHSARVPYDVPFNQGLLVSYRLSSTHSAKGDGCAVHSFGP